MSAAEANESEFSILHFMLEGMVFITMRRYDSENVIAMTTIQDIDYTSDPFRYIGNISLMKQTFYQRQHFVEFSPDRAQIALNCEYTEVAAHCHFSHIIVLKRADTILPVSDHLGLEDEVSKILAEKTESSLLLEKDKVTKALKEEMENSRFSMDLIEENILLRKQLKQAEQDAENLVEYIILRFGGDRSIYNLENLKTVLRMVCQRY